MTTWQTLGHYEYEYAYDANGYIGWYRCVGGRLANGHWPQWHLNTGAER